MKRKTRIILFIIVIILISIYLFLLRHGFLKGYERIEFILVILGMFSTFFGAFIGAKIAGNNSRKLFKQQIKMNDLQQHMDANISILEEMNSINDNIKKIESELKKSFPFYPQTLENIMNNFEEIKNKLERIKVKHLKDASIIIYHDVLQLKTSIEEHEKIFKYPISKRETENLIEKTLNLKVSEVHWIEWSTKYFEDDKLVYEHTREFEDMHGDYIEIPITYIVAKNKDFFDERLKQLRKGISEIVSAYKNMNYKNTYDLKREYIELYED